MKSCEVCGYNKSHQISEASKEDINPLEKLKFETSKITSYSTYFGKSILITNDDVIYVIGDNKYGQISGSLPKKVIECFTEIKLRNGKGSPCTAISAVCGIDYTLYMIPGEKNEPNELAYAHSKIKSEYPVILKIGELRPVSLFGGHCICAAIDSDGGIIYISKSFYKSPSETVPRFFLPESEKAASVACYENFIFALSMGGRIFCSKSEASLSFEEVPELKGQKFVWLSGIREHCIAVTCDGRVFGYGSNNCGRLGLGHSVDKVVKFTEISSLNEYKIVAAYAGSYHSIYQTQEGKLFVCGDSVYGVLNDLNRFQYKPVEATVTGASFCVAGGSSTVIFKNHVPHMSPNMKIDYKSTEQPSQPLQQSTEISSLMSKIDSLERKLAEERKRFEEKLAEKDAEIASLTQSPPQSSSRTPTTTSKNLNILDSETIENLEKLEKISSGSFGKVYKVAKKIIYALKVLKNEVTTEEFRQFLREYELLCLLDHPNIVKTFGIFLSDSKHSPSILLEFCHSNLEQAIKTKSFSGVQIVLAVYQIAEGMRYVHSQKVVHRDLKPTNILIGCDGSIKIGDFGISKLISTEEQSSMTAGVGTQKFMAPEIIDENDKYNEKVDVYSFGVVVFFVLSGGDLPKIKMSEKLKGKKADIPETFTEFSKSLISSCWNFEPDDRPSFDQICSEIQKNGQQMVNLTESEQDEVKNKIKELKEKIPEY